VRLTECLSSTDCRSCSREQASAEKASATEVEWQPAAHRLFPI